MRTTISLSLLSLALGCVAFGCAPPGLEGRRTGDRSDALEGPLVHGVDISVWSGRVTDTEMDCFWDHGVRHVIVGTQEMGIARQQMEMAIEHGMTVDAYVYLVWDGDVRAQVAEAVAFARSYPVGMLWLDVEEDPAGRGRTALEDLIQDAVDACDGFPCGVYTAGWWWQPNMGRSEMFSDLPLWYAYYDGDPSTSTWSAQRVGTWESPWGKQYAGDLDLCGIDVDLNTIQVTTTPTRPHVSPPAPAPGLPAAPTGLSPSGYELQPSWLQVRMLSSAIAGATSYDFAIEVWNGSRYATYYTYAGPTNARAFSPGIADTTYRFRVRATNGAGTGQWSGWSYFQFGRATAHPPEDGSTTPTEPPPTEPPPSEPPPSEPPPSEPPPTDPGTLGAPSPSDGTRVVGSSITLTRGTVAAASSYTFEIEYYDGSAYAHYYTYSGAAATRTFWPAYANTAYRWRERADAGAWSSWSTVLFGTTASDPGATPEPPPSEPPPSEPPPSEPAPAGVPSGLTPNGTTIITSSVTLGCAPVAGAAGYEFAIEVQSGSSFVPYYTYTSASASKTFYPATHGTSYRFRVRAQGSSGYGDYSSYATFYFR